MIKSYCRWEKCSAPFYHPFIVFMGRFLFVVSLGLFLGGSTWAAESTFLPLTMNQGDSESRTGMWFCPDLGGVKDILPLKTRHLGHPRIGDRRRGHEMPLREGQSGDHHL